MHSVYRLIIGRETLETNLDFCSDGNPIFVMYGIENRLIFQIFKLFLLIA